MVTSVMQANAQASAMEQQAAADEQRAEIEAENAEKRAKEETASGQREAAAETRQARLAQSNLIATAGASGGSASDDTVMKLWRDIDSEGRYNAASATAQSAQTASSIRDQSKINTWSARQNANIARANAKSTRIGGYMGAAGRGVSLISKYGGYSSRRAYG